MLKTSTKILLEFNPAVENILPALKKISAVFGFVSKSDAEIAAEYFSVPLAKIYETASFYDLIKVKKQPSLVIKICSSTNCALNNSLEIKKELENYLGVKAGDENNLKIKLETVSCLGHCGEGPVMVVNGKVYENITKSGLDEILKDYI